MTILALTFAAFVIWSIYSMNRDPLVLGQNPKTNQGILMLLGESSRWNVRAGVARNPSTLPETLTLLSQDKMWDVRWNVARNPSTPNGLWVASPFHFVRVLP